MINLYSYYTQVLFIILVIVNHLTEIYLSKRQLKALQENRLSIPTDFKDVISIEEYQKSINYNVEKLFFSQVHLAFAALLLFYWFPMRGAEKLYLAIPNIGVHKEVFFILLFGLIQLILSLPWSIYSTFFLEEKFGFNKTTPKIFIVDKFKGILLSSIIGIPILYLVFYFYGAFPNYWWLLSFMSLTLFQFFLVWIYPTFIAPLFNKFTTLENIELKQGIDKLVTNAGFSSNGVFVMDASKRSAHGNAYFTGFGKNKRIVFFDTLLTQLTNKEVMAVLAHELGHLKLKHIIKSMIISVVLSFIGFYVMGKLANEVWFYRGHFVRIISPGVLLLLFTQAIPIYTFWFSPISSWFSRKNEFEADDYAAKETNAQDMISGLKNLYKHNLGPLVSDSIYALFYYSHPPAKERIEHLKKKVP